MPIVGNERFGSLGSLSTLPLGGGGGYLQGEEAVIAEPHRTMLLARLER